MTVFFMSDESLVDKAAHKLPPHLQYNWYSKGQYGEGHFISSNRHLLLEIKRLW